MSSKTCARSRATRFPFAVGLMTENLRSRWIDVAPRIKRLSLKTIDKPRDHAFISSKTDRELSGRDAPGFDTAKKHTCFLDRHPKSQEAAVE